MSRKLREVLDEVGGLDDISSMLDIVDDLVKTIVQFTAQDITCKLRTLAAIQPDLRRKHGGGIRRLDTRSFDLARFRIQSRGDIGRNDHHVHLVQRRNPNGKRSTDSTAETGAQNGIHNDIRRSENIDELVTRRTNDNVDIPASRAAGDVARNRALDLIGLDRAHDVDRDTLLTQDISGDPAVTTIIAKPNQNHGMMRMGLHRNTGEKFASVFHEGGLRSALLFNEIFEAKRLLDRKNRLHTRYSLSAFKMLGSGSESL